MEWAANIFTVFQPTPIFGFVQALAAIAALATIAGTAYGIYSTEEQKAEQRKTAGKVIKKEAQKIAATVKAQNQAVKLAAQQVENEAQFKDSALKIGTVLALIIGAIFFWRK